MKLVSMIRLRDEDILQIFHRSSGPGGQHVNKVSTAVTLKHIPTGLIVTATDSRSQSQNRALARERLEEKLAESARKKKLAALAEASRERCRKAKRSRGLKARMVESKRRRAETKNLRGKVRSAN
ncbi:MAG: peptide chain release factor-like protein [Verrucomicrobiota bacterium]